MGISGALRDLGAAVGRGGVVPLSESYDHAGPIAWTVEDCALLLDTIAGYDPTDPDSADVPLLDFAAALTGDAWRRRVLALARHHVLELLEARDLHLRHDRPVTLGAEVGHDAHLRHAHLDAQLVHREKLLDHRPDLARLAVHDVADQHHRRVLLLGTGSGNSVSLARNVTSGKPPHDYFRITTRATANAARLSRPCRSRAECVFVGHRSP
jgi:Asp-tRNA(Asn)/Glu-tRNA(Gln) amidotransferase A subunit family amidase